jgi:hypothetical protein
MHLTRRIGSSYRPLLIGLALGVLMLLLGSSTNLARAHDGRGQAIPVEAFWQQVEGALRTVQELGRTDAEEARTTLDDLAGEFGAISAVELVDGRLLPLDNSYLVAHLQDPEPDLERLEATLTAMLAARDRWPDPSHDSQDLVPLAGILARPEFQAVQEELGPLERLRQRITELLQDLLFRLFPESAGGLGPLIRLVLTVAGFVALIAAFIFVLRSVMGDIIVDEESLANGEDGSALVSADQALAQARDHSRRGDYRSAVRYLYISSLMLLEERDLIRYDRTQTNQEYLRGVAGKPELAAILRDVIDVFDRVWYGFQSLDEQSFSHYARRVEQLRQQR